MGSVNRRDFLARLGFGAAGLIVGAELDLERLLWVPKPIISVPDVSLFGNTFISPEWVTHEVCWIFVNNLRVAGRLDRQWDDQWLRSSKAEQLFRNQRGASSTLAGASIS